MFDILRDIKAQGLTYLQEIGKSRSIVADDEIIWEDGEEHTEGPAVL